MSGVPAVGGKRVRLRDVAAEAGVSVSAASLALTGNGRIPEATRERVRAAAETLGYLPNSAARALRTQRHGALGVFVFDQGTPFGLSFYSEAVLAIADEALRQELGVVLVNARPRDGAHAEHALAAARVDAAVCIGGVFGSEDARLLRGRRVPYVFIGKREFPDLVVPYVSTDYVQGGRLATAHLLSLGHRRVAVACEPMDEARPWLRDRIKGHALAIQERGLPADAGPRLVLSGSDADLEAHPQWDARRWLADGITAVFAINHGLALRVLRALRLQGIDVPRQLAVVGFDDPPGADLALPPLTAVRQPLAALGATAARTVIGWAHGAVQEPFSATVPPSLVIRQSCGAGNGAGGPSRN